MSFITLRMPPDLGFDAAPGGAIPARAVELPTDAEEKIDHDAENARQQTQQIYSLRGGRPIQASYSRWGLDVGESPAKRSSVRPTRGHARYVGRVGGLAFALGVGAAVLSGTAIASAETSDSGTESSASAPPTTQTTSRAEHRKAAREARATRRAERKAAADEAAAKSGPTDEDTVTEDEEPSRAANEDAGVTQDADAEPAPRTRRWTRAAAAESTAVADTAAAPPGGSFYFNVTPTLSHDPAENASVGGSIVGSLHPVDPDSTKLTYSAGRPSHGTVKINADGTFVYTPGSSYAGQDRFKVTVSDARSGFHFHGAGGLLGLFTFGLLGGSGHRTTETVLIGFDRAVVASGLDQPTDFRFLPDGRIIVAERGGVIKMVDDSGTVLAQPVATLQVNDLFERGIQGIAVDPDFSSNGYIYVAYTTSDAHDRLSRLTVVGNTAAPDTEFLLFATTETVSTFHRGGGLAFGPDGKLYWAKGDDLTAANAQDLTSIHGKILRINPDGSIPSDNPDLGPGANPLIWAYGLRNPFRMSFTDDGKLLVADVGQSLFEELNLVTKGGNYGWPGSEGLCTSNCAGQTDPIYVYGHGSGAAITAGVYYTGDQLGEGYQNKVFIADEVQGWIKVVTCNADFTTCGNPQTFDSLAGATVMMAQGPDGNLYQLKYDTGELVRIGPAGGQPI